MIQKGNYSISKKSIPNVPSGQGFQNVTEKRLQTIREFPKFGSDLKIAMCDLET